MTESERRAIPAPAAAGLAARYRARAEADIALAIYLRGIIDALGITPEAVTGFDDATGELILAEDAEGTEARQQVGVTPP